jgi:hypothetical protein
MKTQVISIAKQFSPTPAGRYISDGPFPGEKFRNELLIPALEASQERINVDLDGTAGFGSSFLEEAFGGLVRNGYTPAVLRERLNIITSHPSYEARVWKYIYQASLGA